LLIISKYIYGETFNLLGGHISKVIVNNIILKLLLTLDILHNMGIYHRDLHSNNIIISNNFDPIIIDFGLACIGTNCPTFLPNTYSFNPINRSIYNYTSISTNNN